MNFKLFALLALFVLTAVSQAQWQTELQLTNVPPSSVTSYTKCIAASGNELHVVWMDLRDGNFDIYYKRSSDGGTSWGADVRLTSDPGDSEYPSVAADGSLVIVVWHDNRDNNPEIYCKRSTDGGLTWGSDLRLTNDAAASNYPSVTVSGSTVQVVWTDFRDNNYEIYYKRSSDGGVTWGPDIRSTNSAALSQYPVIASSGASVHIVWYDNRDGNFEIYYKHSSDDGVNWTADTRLTFNSADSWFPSISVSGSTVHIAWCDHRDAIGEIYYKRSTDDGVNWEPDVRLTSNSQNSDHPSIAASGSGVHVVYENNQNTNIQIYYKRSTDGGNTWETPIRMINTVFSSGRPSVAVSGQVVHAVWYDSRNGSEEIYYKRNTSGNPVGITPVGSDIPKEFSVSQNYPNPFNPVSIINYQIPKTGIVAIKLYDLLGKEVAVLYDNIQQAGYYKATIDGANLSSGVYLCRITVEGFVKTIKMSLIK